MFCSEAGANNVIFAGFDLLPFRLSINVGVVAVMPSTSESLHASI